MSPDHTILINTVIITHSHEIIVTVISLSVQVRFKLNQVQLPVWSQTASGGGETKREKHAAEP